MTADFSPSSLTAYLCFFNHGIPHVLYMKDLRGAFGPEERSYLEPQLQRYKRVVGPELCERMVYSLG
ncbi:hypothetical protein QN277_015778 [Acacia crassicarpa]|uniref:Uncharacterized protein n=1 Tax=Acacia crassicarpa TaxID=499986 RepID=A0AAE1JW11_9FABA|nr:hypothetical protein QN277_015778 [Acacia crassicarpa]